MTVSRLRSCLLCLTLLPTLTAATSQVPGPRGEAEVHRRATALLLKMTPREKIGQLNVQFSLGASSAASLNPQIESGDLSELLFVFDAKTTNQLQHVAMEKSRLHIPIIFGLEIIHGLHTVFPVPIAMVASWDPGMVERSQTIAAAESRAVGIQWVYSPMVDITRDPRWGRMVEGAGEDPYLGSALAAAQVRGFQGPYLGAPGHVVATVKHLAMVPRKEGAITTQLISPMINFGTSTFRRSGVPSKPALGR